MNHQIIKALDKDNCDLFLINQSDNNLRYVKSFFSISGSYEANLIKGGLTTFHDPTICQYCIIKNKPKSLEGILRIYFPEYVIQDPNQDINTEQFTKTFQKVFFPDCKLSNVSVPLLYLSVRLGHFECFKVLIKFMSWCISKSQVMSQYYQQKYQKGHYLFLEVLDIETARDELKAGNENPQTHEFLRCLLQGGISLTDFEVMICIQKYVGLFEDVNNFYYNTHDKNGIMERLDQKKYNESFMEDENGRLFSDYLDNQHKEKYLSYLGPDKTERKYVNQNQQSQIPQEEEPPTICYSCHRPIEGCVEYIDGNPYHEECK